MMSDMGKMSSTDGEAASATHARGVIDEAGLDMVITICVQKNGGVRTHAVCRGMQQFRQRFRIQISP